MEFVHNIHYLELLCSLHRAPVVQKDPLDWQVLEAHRDPQDREEQLDYLEAMELMWASVTTTLNSGLSAWHLVVPWGLYLCKNLFTGLARACIFVCVTGLHSQLHTVTAHVCNIPPFKTACEWAHSRHIFVSKHNVFLFLGRWWCSKFQLVTRQAAIL